MVNSPKAIPESPNAILGDHDIDDFGDEYIDDIDNIEDVVNELHALIKSAIENLQPPQR